MRTDEARLPAAPAAPAGRLGSQRRRSRSRAETSRSNAIRPDGGAYVYCGADALTGRDSGRLCDRRPCERERPPLSSARFFSTRTFCRRSHSMALSSMTGFARGHGVCGPYAWAWEIKSVNGKGLDLRLRLPPGWDAIEAEYAPAPPRSGPRLHSSRSDGRAQRRGAGGAGQCGRARCGAGDHGSWRGEWKRRRRRSTASSRSRA